MLWLELCLTCRLVNQRGNPSSNEGIISLRVQLRACTRLRASQALRCIEPTLAVHAEVHWSARLPQMFQVLGRSSWPLSADWSLTVHRLSPFGASIRNPLQPTWAPPVHALAAPSPVSVRAVVFCRLSGVDHRSEHSTELDGNPFKTEPTCTSTWNRFRVHQRNTFTHGGYLCSFDWSVELQSKACTICSKYLFRRASCSHSLSFPGLCIPGFVPSLLCFQHPAFLTSRVRSPHKVARMGHRLTFGPHTLPLLSGHSFCRGGFEGIPNLKTSPTVNSWKCPVVPASQLRAHAGAAPIEPQTACVSWPRARMAWFPTITSSSYSHHGPPCPRSARPWCRHHKSSGPKEAVRDPSVCFATRHTKK